MQSLIRSKSAGVTGGRGTAGAGPDRDLLYVEGEENCYAAHTAVDSKETVVVNVAVVVVVETGSCSEVVDSKLVQIR